MFRVYYDFSSSIDLLPGNQAEVLMPVLRNAERIARDRPGAVFVDDLWESCQNKEKRVEPLL
jgi:hypothetical protein